MIATLWSLVFECILATSVAAVLAWALRSAVARRFGFGAAHALWGVVPLSLLAVLLPARRLTRLWQWLLATCCSPMRSLGRVLQLAARRFRQDQELACDEAVITRFPIRGAPTATRCSRPSSRPVPCRWHATGPGHTH